MEGFMPVNGLNGGFGQIRGLWQINQGGWSRWIVRVNMLDIDTSLGEELWLFGFNWIYLLLIQIDFKFKKILTSILELWIMTI